MSEGPATPDGGGKALGDKGKGVIHTTPQADIVNYAKQAAMVQSPAMEKDDFAGVREQDRWLPFANVSRIMDLALPEGAKISKDAKQMMQEAVSEWISFITMEANETNLEAKPMRKTITGEDVLTSMTTLGFENYAEALRIYYEKWKENHSKRSKGIGRKRVKADGDQSEDAEEGNDVIGDDDDEGVGNTTYEEGNTTYDGGNTTYDGGNTTYDGGNTTHGEGTGNTAYHQGMGNPTYTGIGSGSF